MRISLNWIKEFSGVNSSDDEIIEIIGSRIGEIESVEDLGVKYKGVVVAKIVSARDHPDADKLGVYVVDNGQEEVQVVAGDKTLKPGDLVAYMPPGTIVPSTFDQKEPAKIEQVELRGQKSNGMLGSAKELAFSDEHGSVLVLDKVADSGTPLAELYGLNDKIIDVENKALTHRPDCFGIIGFAREVAGVQDIEFKSPEWFSATQANSGDGLDLSVLIEEPDACLRFTAQAYSGVDIRPSPIFMQTMLSRIGIRPINNVVDITNYMMIMSGQPFHAFDYDKVVALSDGSGASLVVRYPREGEKLKLLDGQVIEPHPKAAMVATNKQLLSVGGVMGGADSEVDENTKNIIMEAANWDLYSIRNTSMKHGLFTEAVTRFSRGQDPTLCLPAQTHAAELLGEYADAKVASKLEEDFPSPRKPAGLSVPVDKINSLLGVEESANDMSRQLTNVEFDVLQNGKNLDILAPSWRADINIAEDIVEEIGRLGGYQRIPISLPYRTIEATDRTSFDKLLSSIRHILANAGANEQLSYNFISEKLVKKSGFDQSKLYHLRNAISPELEYLRPALLPSIIERMYPNQRQGYGDFAMFEINKTHSKDDIGGDDLPNERSRLALVFSADKKTAESSYFGAPYYQVCHYLKHLLDGLSLSASVSVKISDENLPEIRHIFHKLRVSQIEINGQPVGLVGEFSDEILRSFKLPLFSAGFEINLEALSEVLGDAPVYQVISKYPFTEHDVTLQLPLGVSFGEVLAEMKAGLKQPELNVDVNGLDIYQDSSIKDTKNLTYRIRLQRDDGTLKTKEVNQMIDSMVKKVADKFDAKRV